MTCRTHPNENIEMLWWSIFTDAPMICNCFLIKSQCFFLPTVALQVGPDGHEGDRMAGAEFPTDRKCKESRRAHQWGIVNLSLPEIQPGVYLLLTREPADGLESLGGPHGTGLPISFWGYLQPNPKTEQDLVPSEFTCWGVKGLFQSGSERGVMH